MINPDLSNVASLYKPEVFCIACGPGVPGLHAHDNWCPRGLHHLTPQCDVWCHRWVGSGGFRL